MGRGNIEDRITKSGSIKVVKMDFSEQDLMSERLSHLKELKEKCERDIPKDVVFLIDLAKIIGIETTDRLCIISKKKGIKVYTKRRYDTNRPASCVSQSDAERLIKHYYGE